MLLHGQEGAARSTLWAPVIGQCLTPLKSYLQLEVTGQIKTIDYCSFVKQLEQLKLKMIFVQTLFCFV